MEADAFFLTTFFGMAIGTSLHIDNTVVRTTQG